MRISRPAHESWFTLHYVCACCWGDLGIDLEDEGTERHYFCLKGPERCSGKGFVTRAYAERRRTASHFEKIEVAQNYPQLAPPRIVYKNDAAILKSLGF